MKTWLLVEWMDTKTWAGAILYDVVVCRSSPSCHTGICSAVMRLYIWCYSLHSVIINAYSNYRIHTQKPTVKFDPLPCFWKCTLSTVYLPEVKIETGRGQKRERAVAHLGGKRESPGQYSNQKLSPAFFCRWKQNPLLPWVYGVWDALEWDITEAMVHVTLYVWVWGALEEGCRSMFLFLWVLFVCKWCALELGICIGMQDCVCECNVLKQTLFFQCCHTVAGHI